jgi:hypothetical protein
MCCTLHRQTPFIVKTWKIEHILSKFDTTRLLISMEIAMEKCASYLVNGFPRPKGELIESKAKKLKVIVWVYAKLKQCTTY